MASNDKSTPRTLEPGEVLLDRYVVEEQVAEGGMAAIHRTLDRTTGRKVAVKVLYPYYVQNPVVCTRFLDEGRIQRYLDHPNIIDVYDIVEKPQLAIVMEYIEGPTLDEYLTDHGPLNAQELLSLMLPVLSAVGFAHHKGVIHRDIKPSNILLDPTPSGMVPKIMDFGVAKVDRAGKELTAAGTTVGTLHYMSPEQIVGSRDIDGRADIYSLGVTIYKLCTGDVPFNASTEFALMMAQVEARPTPPSEIRENISERLEQIILKSLAKKPDGRHQSVKELTSDLLSLERDESDYPDTETDTAPLPARLLEYAMMADEIAIDRTGELDITKFKDVVDATCTKEVPRPTQDSTEADATVQLDADQLKARVLQDKSEQDSGDETEDTNLQPTAPMNRIGRSSADSSARTQPREKPGSDTEAAPTELPADTSSDRPSLSQETTHPFRSEADRSQEPETSHVDSRDTTQRRVVDEGDLDEHHPMRARASKDTATKRSREDAKDEIDRMAREKNATFSPAQRAAFVLGVMLIVGLSVAIGWVLLDV